MKTIKAKVHMLPTDKSYILSINGKIFSTGGVGREMGKKHGLKETIPQHLYITTDEEIKEGDWYIATIISHNGQEIKPLQWSVGDKPCSEQPLGRKIISTTDPKLTIKQDNGVRDINWRINSIKEIKLPQIHQSFIEEYCKAGGIDEVLVEHEEYIKCTNCNLTEEDCECNVSYTQDLIGIDRVKLNPDNTIIIHPVETHFKPKQR
jgi:hypothetical protein